MENKIERLRQSIKSNPNLTEEFKCNVGTLTDTLVTVFPDYDYTNYERVLSNLGVKNDESIDTYSKYDVEKNLVSFNTLKIFEDRIDLQHLFLNQLLSIGSGVVNINPILSGFTNGLTEVISSTMNPDESMKKLNVLESVGVSIFSKIISPETLINGYMTGDFASVVMELESYGISQDEFMKLLDSFNKIGLSDIKENSSFADMEISMTNMFSKMVDAKLKNGSLDYEDIKEEYDEFSDMLIFGKSELISMYPHHDFSNLTGFENVKKELDNAIVNSEMIEEVEMVK